MPSDVPLPSMSIARASAGGLVQSIFSSPSRIATCDQADLYCRDAKLKMLCIIKIGSEQTCGLYEIVQTLAVFLED